MSDFHDYAESYRSQDYIAREHATRELTEGTLDIGALMLVAAGVFVLWLVLG